MGKIGTVIVEDHPVFRQGVRDILTAEGDIYVMSECGDGEEALRQIQILQPEVVVMDINIPKMNGIEVCRKVSNTMRRTSVLLLTAYDDVEQIVHAFRAGAAAYCPKDIEPSRLLHFVREVAAGKYIAGDQIMDNAQLQEWLQEKIDSNPSGKSEGELFSPLSPREMEILKNVTRGMSNKEIAGRLGISHQTVKNHMTAILHKLNVEDRTQAALYAVRHGWVPLAETKRPEDMEPSE